MIYKDKVVIVTGAGQGLGKAIAQAYAEAGAKVVIAEIDQKSGKSTQDLILAKGGIANFIHTDVKKEKDIQNLIKTTVNMYKTVNILINNAGYFKQKSIYDLDLKEWDDIIDTNLRSVFLCSKEVAKIMKENNGGSIVNISSTRALMSEPNSEAYAASKGGIVALTHAMAASLAKDKIQVNCISPGWIETDNYKNLKDLDHKQHFAGRVGKPKDISNLCLYLTKNENNFISGTNIIVDGGMTKKMIYD